MKYSEWFEARDARGNEYDPMQSTGMRGNFESAVEKIQQASQLIQAIMSGKGYSVNQVKEIRTLLLRAVREDLDPAAFGHMPDKRHY